MKTYYLFVVALIFCVYSVKAQLPSGTYADYFQEGNFLLLEEDYDGALRNFLEAYKLDSSSANINFNIGFCCLSSSTKKGLAEKYLAKSITSITKNYREADPSEKSAPPLAYFYYGRALHLNYKFNEAVEQYDFFEKNYAKDKATKAEVNNYKQQTAYAKELIAAPIDVKIENLGDSINSEYPDFSPVLSADERMIIYTTSRNTSIGGEKSADGKYYEDIVISYKDDNGKWSSPKSIGDNINTGGNEASINLTPDGQTLIAYKSISEKDGNIFYSTWDGKDWSSLQEFGSDINSKYWEPHACLSADNNVLYFVSNRPGGYGGRDIYRCVKLPNGKWSLAQNVGPVINTEYDEDGPFIHPDGVTLMFSSSGHKTMGGFDIFFSTMEEDRKFSEPTNMGYPINTPDDDVFFVTSPDGKRGYFSSSKDGGVGEKDIYMMYIPDVKEKPLALFKGSILSASGEKLPADLAIIVTDKETGALVGTYKPRENGSFATILPPSRNYNFSYQNKGEEFYNEDIFVSDEVSYQEIRKEINLEPISLLGKVKVKDKRLTLNVIVFNNQKDKKPVPNTKITLSEKGGADISFNTDNEGKKEAVDLTFDKVYTVVAQANEKKSAASTFNTNAINGIKSITQIIYLEAKPEKTFNLFLNIVVVNKKSKPLPESKVIVTGNDGSKYEGITDSKGCIKNIELLKDVNYDLIAENNGLLSEKALFTTMNAISKKVYEKTLVIDIGSVNKKADVKTNGVKNNDPLANNTNASNTNASSQTNMGCGSAIEYKHYFAYNQNQVDDADDWSVLIDGIVSKTKECSPTVKILSSASQVTTRNFADNHELAKSRAEKIEEKIKQAVTAKGGDASKIIFKQRPAVRGPAYIGDYENIEKYGKYQYVKVIAR